MLRRILAIAVVAAATGACGMIDGDSPREIKLTQYSEAVRKDVRDEAGGLTGPPCEPRAKDTRDCSSVKTMLSEYGFLRGRVRVRAAK